MASMFAKPIWAGVVIRMSDGRLITAQLDNSLAQIFAELDMEYGVRDTEDSGLYGYREMEHDGTFRLKVTLSGVGRNWNTADVPQARQALAEAPLSIEPKE